MKREDLDKLLGGFASDTLSEEERKALFEAALQDQQLFDALAREDALREVLENAPSRRQILAALEEQPVPAWRRAWEWFARPQAWALAGGMAATVVLAVLMVRVRTQPEPLVQLAKRQDIPAAAAPVPAEAPAAVEPQRQKPKQAVAPRPAKRDTEPSGLQNAPRPVLAGERASAAEGPPALLTSSAPPAPPALQNVSAPPPPAAAAASDTATELRAERKQERLVVTPRVVVQLTPQQLYDQGSPAAGGGVEATHFVPARKAGEPERADVRARISALPTGMAAQPVGLLPRAFGLRYAVLPGEPMRLDIQANEAGYLYVFAADRQLFSGPVQARRPYLVDVPDPRPPVRIVLVRQPQIAPRQATRGPQLTESAGGINYVVNPSPPLNAVVVAEVSLAPR